MGNIQIVQGDFEKKRKMYEWHTSETAKLYEPAIFENKKEDKGYWF